MIRDIESLSRDEIVHADVGIIGAGFAGIELARVLGEHGVRVVVLESGREHFDPATQSLARFESIGRALRTPDPDGPFTPYLPPEFRGEFRIRQFGGTSNIWTGKWRRFDDLDFAARPWIPHSGWPITRKELEPYYRAVAHEYGLGDFDAFARSAPFVAASERLGAAGLTPSFHYWEKTATRPARRFGAVLERSTCIDVILGANATELQLDRDLASVREVAFASLAGARHRLIARRFVLAVGGLEGARLLLASNRQLAPGIGNASGMVGRFHSDHPKTKRVKLRHGPALAAIEEWTRTAPRPCFHVSLSLADHVQETKRLAHHAVYLRPVFDHEVGYPSETLRGLEEAVRKRAPLRVAQHAIRLLGSPTAVRKILQRRRSGRKGGKIVHYTASLYVEQIPNPESTLGLSAERDALGMPRLRIDWQLTPLDHENFERLTRELTLAFERAGLGRLDFGPAPLTLDDLVDAAHHIGATRMAATAEQGVVDRECRVFGTSNLYIASSSVFPTGHSAAPTLTILALARRLADHLLHAQPAGDSGREARDEAIR